MRTFHPKESDIHHAWHVIDAEGIVLGRLATEIAQLLRGKHKPTFAPNVDNGDHVIVVNASKIDISLRKSEDKLYYRHSGYPGGIRSESLGQLLGRNPERVIKLAVRGMLPKTRLGRSQLKNLRVYSGPAHPHAAQMPQTRVITTSRKAS
ncbi:MAG: 50S ribosomal protein L13 [Acidimicrobiia bacterium]